MRFLRSTSQSTRLIAVALLMTTGAAIAATVLSLSGGIAGASLPAPPTPTPGTVEPGGNHDGLAKATTREEAARILATADAEGRITKTTGTTTAGSVLDIAGRKIQLPEDAYVKHRWISGECIDPDRCPRLPVYVVARWNSSIGVGSEGLMIDERLAPGEEDAFDFLREALR